MKPSVQYRTSVATGVTFAVAVAALSLASLSALAWPRAGGWPVLAQAQSVLATEAYGRDTGPDLEAGAQAARRLVEVAPADGPAWLAVAYADLAASGRLGPTALAAIDRSYAVMPFDPDPESWRLRLLLERWPDVPPSLRAHALAELEAKGPRARPIADAVRDPAGRLAAQMVVPPKKGGTPRALNESPQSHTRAAEFNSGG